MFPTRVGMIRLDKPLEEVLNDIKLIWSTALKHKLNHVERALTNDKNKRTAYEFIRRGAGEARRKILQVVYKREGISTAEDVAQYAPSTAGLPGPKVEREPPQPPGLREAGPTEEPYLLRESDEPYNITGLPETDASIAAKQPLPEPGQISPKTKRGPLKSPEWIKIHLGGLEFVKPLEMPELYKLTRMLGADTQLKVMRSRYGHFKGIPGAPEIALDKRIFTNPTHAATVWAHEIGHLGDWLDDKTLARGNIIGRIRSLHKYMKRHIRGYDRKEQRTP